MNLVSRSTMARFVVLSIAIVGAGYYSATHTIDVPIYREAGRQVLARNYDIYSAVAEGGFRYAPITALLFVPLALIPVWLGASLMFAFKVCALFATAAIVVKMMAIDRAHYGKVCLLAFLTAGGYLAEDFRTGNIHFLSFFLIVMAIYLVERGRTVAPSVLLALATALKLTPLLFVFYYGLRKRFALCVGTMVVLVALFALPAAFVGVAANNTLMDGFIGSATQRLDEPRNHSLRGVLFRYLTDSGIDAGLFPSVNVLDLSSSAVTVLWYALVACVVVALAAGVAFSRRSQPSTIFEYAFLMAAVLLLSPHSLRMYFSILFFPLCVLSGVLAAYPAHPHRTLIRATLGVSFAAGTLMPSILPGREAALAYEALSPHFFAGALVCWTLGLLRWKADGMSRAGP